MRSKGRAQELFRSVRGDVALLVVRPPSDYTARYEEDLDTLLDTQVSLCNYFISSQIYFMTHKIMADMHLIPISLKTNQQLKLMCDKSNNFETRL